MYLGTMWWIVLVIFATAVVVSVCTFLLQWSGCCVQHTDHTGTHVRVQMGWGYGFDVHRGQLDEARRQRVAARQQALRANQVKGLPQHALSNLSSFTIKNKDEPSTNDLDCTICQEDLCQETVASLPCGHIFHKKCIWTWLKRKATCPTCRLELTAEMLKVKQAPAVGLTPPATADIERGIPVNTDIKPSELNDPLGEAPIVVVIPAMQEDGTAGTEADGLPAPEEAQHVCAPRVAVLRDTENQLPT